MKTGIRCLRGEGGTGQHPDCMRDHYQDVIEEYPCLEHGDTNAINTHATNYIRLFANHAWKSRLLAQCHPGAIPRIVRVRSRVNARLSAEQLPFWRCCC